MILSLMDWRNAKHDFDIGELEDIGAIHISIISGDEIATVIYKDYSFEVFRSNYAQIAWDDGSYILYNQDINYLNYPRWLERENSYIGMDVAQGFLR